MSVNSKMTAIADAIRAKTGGTDPLGLDAMAQAIAAISGGVELPDFISEINFGTFKPASTTTSYVNIEHGLSGAPSMYVIYLPAVYETNRYRSRYVFGYGYYVYDDANRRVATLLKEYGGTYSSMPISTLDSKNNYFNEATISTAGINLVSTDTYYWLAWR